VQSILGALKAYGKTFAYLSAGVRHASDLEGWREDLDLQR
jgi:hypothetical protein